MAKPTITLATTGIIHVQSIALRVTCNTCVLMISAIICSPFPMRAIKQSGLFSRTIDIIKPDRIKPSPYAAQQRADKTPENPSSRHTTLAWLMLQILSQTVAVNFNPAINFNPYLLHRSNEPKMTYKNTGHWHLGYECSHWFPILGGCTQKAMIHFLSMLCRPSKWAQSLGHDRRLQKLG